MFSNESTDMTDSGIMVSLIHQKPFYVFLLSRDILHDNGIYFSVHS